MKISIDAELLNLDDNVVRYDRYLSTSDVRSMLREWASRLTTLGDGVAYLPYSIDDEFIDAFEVTMDGKDLSLTVVKLDNLGYLPGVDSFLNEMRSMQPIVVKRYPERFLVCDRQELIEAAKLASE
jgi:hypothetical protein